MPNVLPDTHLPLGGVTVVEWDTGAQAQFAGRLLAQLGADVVLAEPQGGSATRRRPPILDGPQGPVSATFAFLNDDKSVVMPGVAELDALVSRATIVLTGASAWAADAGRLAAPVVVVDSLYGLEPDMARALQPTSPLTRYSAGGDGFFLPTSKDPSLRPTVPGQRIGDYIAGTGLALAALDGLQRHRGSGKRQHVDFAEQAYHVTMNKMFVSQSSYYGAALDRFTHTYPFGGNLPCRDGYIAMLVLEEHQWHGLCEMVGHPEWRADPLYVDGVSRRKNGAEVDRAVRAWCAERTTTDVIAAGRRTGVPIGLLSTPRDVLGHPRLRERRFIETRKTSLGAVDTVGLPFGPQFLAPDRADERPAAEPPAPQRENAVPAAADGRTGALKVLDMTWAGAGPIITWFLASTGAEVAKVEHPSRPDLLRRANRTYGWAEDDDLDGSPAFNEMNAGKKSVVIDLRTQAGRATALRLAAEADIVCESMRPGRVEALGLGYEAVRAVNPSVIYCSLSATGRSKGVDAGLPGYAPVFWAEGGGAWLSGWPEAAPDYVRSPVDMHAGAFATVGILAALDRRRATGAGGYIDLSAIEAVSSTIGDVLLAVAAGALEPVRQGNDDPPAEINDVFPCRGSQQWIAVSVQDADQRKSLAAELGFDAGALDGAAPAVVRERIAAATVDRDAEDLARDLMAVGVAASRVNSLLQLLADPGLVARGYWQDLEHPVLGVQRLSRLPWKVAGGDPVVRGRAPLLDEDTDDVLGSWLGVPEAELQTLRASGAVGGRQGDPVPPVDEVT